MSHSDNVENVYKEKLQKRMMRQNVAIMWDGPFLWLSITVYKRKVDVAAAVADDLINDFHERTKYSYQISFKNIIIRLQFKQEILDILCL